MFSYVITVGALLSSAGSIFAKCGRVRFLASLVDGVTSENSCALLQSLLISPSVFVKWLGDSTAASPTRFSKIREIVSFCVCVLNQVKKKKTLGREILESIAGRSVKWRLICVRVISVFDVSHYEEESLE